MAWDGVEIVPDDAPPDRDTSHQPIISSDEPAKSRPITASDTVNEVGFVHSGGRPLATDFSWLGRDSTAVSNKRPDGGGTNVNNNRSLRATVHRPSPIKGLVGQESVRFLDLSPGEKRERVAIALDRMGGAVVEVRDAFERWVTPVIVNNYTDVSNTDSIATAVTSALTELRLPTKVATEASKGAGAKHLGSVTFSEFVARYAEVAGLEKTMSDSGETPVWAEGPEGIWVPLSPERLAGTRAVFDQATEELNETSSYLKGANIYMPLMDIEGGLCT